MKINQEMEIAELKATLCFSYAATVPQIFDKWFEIVKPVLFHEEYLKRKAFLHHANMSLYEHCVQVSFKAFTIAINRRCTSKQIRNCAIAGVLHDFYTHAWRVNDEIIKLGLPYCEKIYPEKIKNRFFDNHAFSHPLEALENSRKYFPELLNKKIEDAIKFHMFPLTRPLFRYPKYREGKILYMADKVGGTDVFKDFEEFKIMIGIKRKD